MARRRKARVVNPVVEEEVEEILEEEELEEDEEEVVEPKPATRRRRKRKVVEPEPEEDEDEEEEEEVEVEVVSKPAPRRRKKKVVEPEPEEDEDEPAPTRRKRVKKVVKPVVEEAFSSADMFEAILDGLAEDQTVIVTRAGDGWVLSAGTADTVLAKPTLLRGRAYSDEVQSDEFKAHKAEWRELTFSEKKAHAKKIKAVWEPHDDSRVEVMRITSAVRTKLGIEKYKPEYRSRAARAAIRG